jgi:endonuclease/exonuclease/phosphatase family metal-dependent hydrolase
MLRALLLVCAVVYGMRFPPTLISAATVETPSASNLSVMSWNVLAGGRYDKVMEMLRTRPAAIVGIVEADWHRLASDHEIAQLYTFRWGLQVGSTVNGEALLSAYPIIEQGIVGADADAWAGVPRAIWARLDIGLGRNLVVVVAHPPPGRLCTRQTFPRNCYDTSTRDSQIALVNDFVQPYLEAGEPLLLIGDFNVTEREPAYNDLSAGLVDSHRAVGSGIGATWRPKQIMSQPFAILRIDYIFAGPGLTPISTGVDCTPRGSDHCIVTGDFELK